jgi:ribosomal protein S18 acetylase RimI-like enzyme
MSDTYLKRYRMEIDLRDVDLVAPALPPGYVWQAWSPLLIAEHARVCVAAFQGSSDADLFPRLGSPRGCQQLMRDIATHECFVPATTWLIRFQGNDFTSSTCCGAVQGLGGVAGSGAIQNVAVLPEHRNFGLGRALVIKSLLGFSQLRLFRVALEVSAINPAAVHLYESIGFQHHQTSYKKIAADARQLA